jgi:hypothetical protein
VPFFEQGGKSKMMEMLAGTVTGGEAKQSQDFLQIPALLFRKTSSVLG